MCFDANVIYFVCIHGYKKQSKEWYHCRERKHRKLYGNKLGVSYNVFIVSTIE